MNEIFMEIFDFKNFFQILYNHDDVLIRWWVSIFDIWDGQPISTIKTHIVLRFHVSISYGVWDISIYVIFHTFKNVTITS